MQQQQKGAPLTLFYSYAHEDELLRAQLEKHLRLLSQKGLISEWHDRHVIAGRERAQEIDAHLETASIILLLISPDFLASDYCDVEMKRALERSRQGEAHVIPIFLRPVYWEGAPFAHLRGLPHGERPITSWRNQDEAFEDVVRNINRVIKDPPSFKASTPHLTHTFPGTEDNHVSASTIVQRQTMAIPSLSQFLKQLLLPQPPRRRRSQYMILFALLVLVGSIICLAILLSTHLWTPDILHTNGATVHVITIPSTSPTITISTPKKTLQTLCNVDYQKSWDLLSPTFRTETWHNESTYASDLKNRGHHGVANCTIVKVTQTDSYASGTIATTFNDGTIDTKTFHITKERDDVWRIDAIVS